MYYSYIRLGYSEFSDAVPVETRFQLEVKPTSYLRWFYTASGSCFFMERPSYYYLLNSTFPVCRYMTVKRGDHCNSQPPHRYASRFCRVNKLVVDSGIIVYNSTAQCFDKNYNSMDLRVQKDGQFDLPGPSVRLS